MACAPPSRPLRILAASLPLVTTLVGAFFLVAHATFSTRSGWAGFDADLARWLAGHTGPTLLAAAAGITHLADTATRTTLLALAAAALLVRRRPWAAALVAVAIGGVGLLTHLAKDAYARPRPLHDGILITTSGWSFPSGHASGAIATYGILACLLLEVTPPRFRALLVAGATLLVVGIAASRVVLRVHWFSDVIAGLILGGAWLTLCVAARLVLRPERVGASAPP